MVALLLYYVEETLPLPRARPAREAQPSPSLNSVSELTRSRQAPRLTRPGQVRCALPSVPSYVGLRMDPRPVHRSKLLLDPLDVWRRLRVAGD